MSSKNYVKIIHILIAHTTEHIQPSVIQYFLIVLFIINISFLHEAFNWGYSSHLTQYS